MRRERVEGQDYSDAFRDPRGFLTNRLKQLDSDLKEFLLQQGEELEDDILWVCEAVKDSDFLPQEKKFQRVIAMTGDPKKPVMNFYDALSPTNEETDFNVLVVTESGYEFRHASTFEEGLLWSLPSYGYEEVSKYGRWVLFAVQKYIANNSISQ